MNSNTLTVLENNNEFVSRKEHEAAILQICREIADDRKRITLQEENSARQNEFSKTLYSILWMRMKSTRMEFEAKLRKLLPCSSPTSADQSTEVTD